VLCVETSQAGEGVQFKHVRRIYLVDVPQRHSELVQRASRCVRLGGHEGLPDEERKIAVELHLAQLPKFLRQGPSSLIYRELLNAKEVHSTPGAALEAATEECMKEIRRRGVKTLLDLQRELQADDGEKLIELLTETALEQLGDTSAAPARPLAMALWRLRKGGDDLAFLEKALLKEVKTADDHLLEWLIDKSRELLPALEAMRLAAVDRQLLAPLGDPPRAPPAMPAEKAALAEAMAAGPPGSPAEAADAEDASPGAQAADAEDASPNAEVTAIAGAAAETTEAAKPAATEVNGVMRRSENDVEDTEIGDVKDDNMRDEDAEMLENGEEEGMAEQLEEELEEEELEEEQDGAIEGEELEAEMALEAEEVA